MHITVLGATGPTGLAIVEQALARGWHVTALVRSPSKLQIQNSSLRVVAGDVLDPAAIRDCARDAAAILSVLGAPAGFLWKGKTTIYSDAARAIVGALAGDARTRVVFCTSAGVEAHDPSEVFFYRHIAKPLFLQRGYDDMRAAEAILRASSLRFILARPGRLVDGPGGRPLRVSERFRPPGGINLTRADLARFMLDQVESDEWLGRTPTLTE